MPLDLPSEAASLAMLSILLLAALIVAAARPPAADTERVVRAASLNLALQALHVAEEFSWGFHERAPALMGLEAWSDGYFVWVNLAAIAAWSLALGAFAGGRANRLWSGLFWFLALASLGNALWHPASSIAIGGYFPGTVTAPFLGLAGYRLARALGAR